MSEQQEENYPTVISSKIGEKGNSKFQTDQRIVNN
jgi:hypothetical protein